MKREEIIEIVNNFLIEDIETDPANISETASLKNDIGIDSLDFVDLVVIVERNFGFKINPEEMVGVTTLGQFYDYIEGKVGDK
jgi:acyl carrier protein